MHRCAQVCARIIPEPPLGEVPGANPLHAALQVEQSCNGLFQTLFILLILTLLLQLLWKQGSDIQSVDNTWEVTSLVGIDETLTTTHWFGDWWRRWYSDWAELQNQIQTDKLFRIIYSPSLDVKLSRAQTHTAAFCSFFGQKAWEGLLTSNMCTLDYHLQPKCEDLLFHQGISHRLLCNLAAILNDCGTYGTMFHFMCSRIMHFYI